MPEIRNSNNRKLEKQLKAVAHDLNNILSSTMHSITLLKQKIEKGTDEFSLVEIIESNSNRAADIIDVLLDDKKSVTRTLNVSRLLNEVILAFSSTITPELKIKTDIVGEVYKIFGMRSNVYRIIMNLLVNAKESIEGTGEIYISLSNLNNKKAAEIFPNIREANYIQLSISDTGCGISKENISKIFVEEYSTKNKSGISGLGLNIVKEIVTSMGGYIFVESELDKGSTFTVLFPEFKKKEMSKKIGLEKTILISEDDKILLKLLAELLESYNFKVIKTEDGEGCLQEFISESKIDLIIIDKKMPNLDGIDCVRKIREMKIDVPVILSSGSKGEVSSGLLKELKIEKVLHKPYDFEQMLSLIEELVY
ncbi:MAG: hybrid sensor histidine kinase/response regulator [Ignavibacteriae bacterium]|nr:hybrid sensor histidine kinase/response regulator [Ignavibacteriota bacterium]NOG97236.1 hybrid sensor histidine kinase/response regulator [Ignavibacteriota bacterium]